MLSHNIGASSRQLPGCW